MRRSGKESRIPHDTKSLVPELIFALSLQCKGSLPENTMSSSQRDNEIQTQTLTCIQQSRGRLYAYNCIQFKDFWSQHV